MSLTNHDIIRISEKLKLPIVGVYSKDELKKLKPEVGTYHINMSDANKAGTHWTLLKIFCDKDRKVNAVKGSRKECEALYFDSFGIDMPLEVKEFLKPFRPIAYSNRHIQNINSEVCGWYGLLLDYALEYKQVSNSYLEDYEKFLNSWSDSTIENTKLLKERFKKIN
jgi:hypothetical protein